MKYAIIEDEKYSIAQLKNVMQELRPTYKLVFTSSSVVETIEILKRNPEVDFIFMDVELVDGNCFEIFKAVKVITPIIFITAYDNYALQAFKLNSIDYLLKPISERDVETALNKFEELKAKCMVNAPAFENLEQIFNKKYSRRLLISNANSISYIEISDVSFFLSEDNYIYAYMHSGRSHITSFNNLESLLGILDPEKFFRISRNVITSISGIDKINKFIRGRLMVKLKYGTELYEVIVSSDRRSEFLNWLGQ